MPGKRERKRDSEGEVDRKDPAKYVSLFLISQSIVQIATAFYARHLWLDEEGRNRVEKKGIEIVGVS